VTELTGDGETVEYYPGQLADILVPSAPARAVMLLWHGSGPNERDVLRTLAEALRDARVVVVVPDWNSHNSDGGRAHLLASLVYARDRVALRAGLASCVLGGWSLGASAGLDLLVRPDIVDGWLPSAFVGVAGGYTSSPFSQIGRVRDPPSVPMAFFHGIKDEIVPISMSRDVVDRLRTLGRAPKFTAIETDHAGVIGTSYDPQSHRCRPSLQPGPRAAVVTVVSNVLKLLDNEGDVARTR